MAAKRLKRRAAKGRKKTALKSTSWRKTAANQVNWQQVSDVTGCKKRKTLKLSSSTAIARIWRNLCAQGQKSIFRQHCIKNR